MSAGCGDPALMSSQLREPMNLTCPCCHARYSVDAVLQDEAARDLLALRGSLPPRIWNPLLAYLGLFRSESRALAWDKALKLAREIQEMGIASGEWDKLENALAETVESLRQRGGKPLKNHNYLKRVVENTASTPLSDRPRALSGVEGRTSKAAQAIKRLENWVDGDWLRQQISVCLTALVAQNLKFAPAAEIITANADIWYVSLKTVLTIESVDTERLYKAFHLLIPKLTEWPQPKQLIELLPPRPHRQAIRHELSEGDRVAGSEMMKAIREQFE